MKRSILLGVLLLIVSGAWAQDESNHTADLQQFSDELLGLQDADINYEERLENMSLLLSNPLNLNKVTSEELRTINILSELQIQEFIKYRETYGELLSVYELQSVPEFDLITIHKVLPFITVPDPGAALDKSLILRLLHENNNYFLIRVERTLEKQQGFNRLLPAEEQFNGAPEKTYLRFRTSRSGDFSMGFTLENDPGESLIWNPAKNQFGFDYTSFHLQLQNKGSLRNILLGDFQLQAGQGLVAGTSFGWGKGAETITTTRKSNVGLMPYTSSVETGYFHGAGATYQLARYWQLTGFYSLAPRDASLGSDSTETPSIVSFQTTGFHRNEKELSTKNNAREACFGSIFNYTRNSIDAGVIFQSASLGVDLDKKKSPYNQFSYASMTSNNASVFLNYSFHNFTFFSEAAKNLSAGSAVLVGLLGSLSKQLDVSLVYRNYARNYYAPHSNAFGESSLTQNENGIYWGFKYQAGKKYFLSGYADFFSFPWLHYRSYAPSNGHEWLLRSNYVLNRNSLVVLQVREESKLRNLSDNTSTNYRTDNGIKRNYLFYIQYGIAKSIRFRTRAQMSTFNYNNKLSQGFLLTQDIRWNTGPITITARHALFHTEDYDNRLYSYEDDVRLAFSIPAYHGIGIRDYIMVESKLNKQLSCWLRYAFTRYEKQQTIGTGLDSINGNERHDVKLQVMIKL